MSAFISASAAPRRNRPSCLPLGCDGSRSEQQRRSSSDRSDTVDCRLSHSTVTVNPASARLRQPRPHRHQPAPCDLDGLGSLKCLNLKLCQCLRLGLCRVMAASTASASAALASFAASSAARALPSTPPPHPESYSCSSSTSESGVTSSMSCFSSCSAVTDDVASSGPGGGEALSGRRKLRSALAEWTVGISSRRVGGGLKGVGSSGLASFHDKTGYDGVAAAA